MDGIFSALVMKFWHGNELLFHKSSNVTVTFGFLHTDSAASVGGKCVFLPWSKTKYYEQD